MHCMADLTVKDNGGIDSFDLEWLGLTFAAQANRIRFAAFVARGRLNKDEAGRTRLAPQAALSLTAAAARREQDVDETGPHSLPKLPGSRR